MHGITHDFIVIIIASSQSAFSIHAIGVNTMLKRPAYASMYKKQTLTPYFNAPKLKRPFRDEYKPARKMHRHNARKTRRPFVKASKRPLNETHSMRAKHSRSSSSSHLESKSPKKGRRIQYHIQGVRGPKSYKFGFETGDEKNPQSRHETRDRYGRVSGHYSYIDSKGQVQTVFYRADDAGFKVSSQPFKSKKS
ncbi:uncharacterized protein B4U79_05470 [Dinothrombium tinctorium]|uniref:Cuticle protein 6 n=1 Tax=Dinothrombium tinctorium TaxID=1965070 RepID=A0A3S3PJE8_9ACAR|nr:uncharacterized protein B4U79_10075 [Dinothrombium tinctorium]RWS17813.1 uncharacterized protein B4U79_05470 [Dinothrombium tinctorium]